MSIATAVLVSFNFWVIGALPLVFFRRDGRLNAAWWLTALPLFISPIVVMSVALGTGPAMPARVGPVQDVLATLASAASLFIVGLTLGSHRVRLALWHQRNDAPESVVVVGAYKYIRHPFYLAFLLAMTSAACVVMHPITAACLIWSWVALNTTAAQEEKRLLAAPAFGEQYREYMRRTGRFIPRFHRGDSAHAPAIG